MTRCMSVSGTISVSLSSPQKVSLWHHLEGRGVNQENLRPLVDLQWITLE